jgi:ATP-binding cassette subfamily E protein 1
MSKNTKKDKGGDGLTRVAIIKEEKCKPKKCRQECKRSCPVVRLGKECIEVGPTSKLAYISEELCIGCGICVKKCPFDAINIINLPKNLESQIAHRYGPNSFKLHRLPMPRPGQILGLVGTNGIGKSTALKILAGKQKPNLGKFESPPDWSEVLTYYRGSELQNYFTKILEDNLKAIIKPQYVDHIPRAVKGKLDDIMDKKCELDNKAWAMTELELNHVKDRSIEHLSGGELQRFAIAISVVQKADVYMFDEPSSYLDVKQRLRAARTIRTMCEGDQGHARYVLVVEHDLAVLDYLSDYICCLYGTPSAYGVVTMPFSVREGINIFLAGFVPTENLRFREEELNFKLATSTGDFFESSDKRSRFDYPTMTKTMQSKEKGSKKFTLHVEGGSFTDSEIIVMLGENGTGKTTFIRMMAGLLKSDEAVALEEAGDTVGALAAGVPQLNVSYKPQKISPKFQGTVRQLLHKKIRDSYIHPVFVSDVMKPMSIEPIFDNGVQELSGGELQRVAIVMCLGTPADIYLLDEPSAYLDSEQRISASKVIKKFILHAKKTAFVVEHDFIMATYLADRVIVYDGNPGIETTAHAPQNMIEGMNTFLRQLEVTFRRDPVNARPRINKGGSVKDQDQKKSGDFFFMDDES